MAKTIKFNLICDGNPVRTLEDLKNNFSIEDVLDFYNNKLLHKWLSVRGYTEESKKVEDISETDELKILYALIDIFEVEADKEKIREDTYILQYKSNHKKSLDVFKQIDFKVDSIIADHQEKFTISIDFIINNSTDMPRIKAALNEISLKYLYLFDCCHRHMFNVFYNNNARMAIFPMLMNLKLRNYYMLTDDETSIMKTTPDKKVMYEKICELIKDYDGLKNILGDNLKEFSGMTDDYWKDVEPKGKKYMVLKMESGNFVRASGTSGGDKSSTDVNYMFLILDGIDYKSNNASNKLLYMEV